MTAQKLLGAANGFMLVLFASWAMFQYNDPDGLLWIVVYGLAVTGIVLFEYDRAPARPLWVLSGIMVLWGIYWGVQFAGQPALLMPDAPMFVEEGREMVGSWIVAAWMALLARNSAYRAERTAEA